MRRSKREHRHLVEVCSSVFERRFGPVFLGSLHQRQSAIRMMQLTNACLRDKGRSEQGYVRRGKKGVVKLLVWFLMFFFAFVSFFPPPVLNSIQRIPLAISLLLTLSTVQISQRGTKTDGASKESVAEPASTMRKALFFSLAALCFLLSRDSLSFTHLQVLSSGVRVTRHRGFSEASLECEKTEEKRWRNRARSGFFDRGEGASNSVKRGGKQKKRPVEEEEKTGRLYKARFFVPLH